MHQLWKIMGAFWKKGKKDHKLVLEDVNMLVNHCRFALLYVNCGPLFFFCLWDSLCDSMIDAHFYQEEFIVWYQRWSYFDFTPCFLLWTILRVWNNELFKVLRTLLMRSNSFWCILCLNGVLLLLVGFLVPLLWFFLDLLKLRL